MTRTILICTLAALAAISPAGSATAQVVVDGIVIPPEDMGRARSYCNSLAAASRQSLTSDEGADLIEPSSDPASSYSRGANSMDNALSSFDLNRLTLRRCRAAGLV